MEIGWPYLGGLSDAEACIYFHGSVSYTMSQKKGNILKLLSAQYGGNLGTQLTRGVPMVRWDINARRILPLLKDFLIVKRPQALIALKRLELVGTRGTRVSDENKILRMGLQKELSTLKLVFPSIHIVPNDKYIAGFTDGEGTFSIHYTNRNRSSFRPSFSVSQRDGNILRAIQHGIGGTITAQGSAAYKLRAESIPAAHAIATRLIPHLICKKQEALLLKEFCELKMSDPNSAASLKEQKRMYKEMRRLKTIDTVPLDGTGLEGAN